MTKYGRGRPTALVTGASGGIGAAIVKVLATDHSVIACARAAGSLDSLVRDTGASPWYGDLVAPKARTELAAGVPHLDVLVHAAGVGAMSAFAEATETDWRTQFDINLIAPAELTRLLLPALRYSRGTLVFLGSGIESRAAVHNGIYGATKRALKALAETIMLEESAYGVRVSTVAPGPTDTLMLRGRRASSGGNYSAHEYLSPATVAQAVRFVIDLPDDGQATDVTLRPRMAPSK